METLLSDLCFGEGPRWHEGRLWFSDMHAHEVMAVDLAGKRETICEVPGHPSGLGWLPDGDLLVVSMQDRRVLRLPRPGALGGPQLREWADLSSLTPHLCNDAIVDARGRCYVGNFGFDLHGGESPRTTTLILVDAEGKPRIVADELSFPNGMVITPDGATLIVGETFAARLSAFEIAEDGSLSGRRVWAAPHGAIPDGICLDAENAVWVASPVTREVVRVHEGGEVSQRIAFDQQAFACMLGGPEGRHLFVCTADDPHPEACVRDRSARIRVAEVEVPRAGLP